MRMLSLKEPFEPMRKSSSFVWNKYQETTINYEVCLPTFSTGTTTNGFILALT